MISAMAKDMGILQFQNESDTHFINRVLYSSMSCWIKAVAMDRSLAENCFIGVSKKSVLIKCSRVLDEMLLRYSQAKTWFIIENSENPITIIRQRLLRAGDLVNVGYDSNIGLAVKNEYEIGYGIRQLIGSVRDCQYVYAGIALVTQSGYENREQVLASSEWLMDFIKNAWWKAGSCIDDNTEFYDPKKQSMNFFSCWVPQKVSEINSIVLTRHRLHNQTSEYVIERNEKGNTYYHRLDPYLQETHEYRRIMFALRVLAGNSVAVKICSYGDYIQLSLKTHLPDKERVVLETFAWPHETITDVLKWDVPIFIWPYIRELLTRLGLKILEEQHG